MFSMEVGDAPKDHDQADGMYQNEEVCFKTFPYVIRAWSVSTNDS